MVGYIEVADLFLDRKARVDFETTDDKTGIFVSIDGEKCQVTQGNLRVLAALQKAATEFMNCFNDHLANKHEGFMSVDE